MSTDVEDDYGDEWGDEQKQAADVTEEAQVGAGGGAVHPYPLLAKLEGYADGDAAAVDPQDAVHPLYCKEAGKLEASLIKSVNASVAAGEDDNLGRHCDLGIKELPAVSNTAKHTRHYQKDALMPPPAPPLRKNHTSGSLVTIEDDTVDRSALYARVAAMRISEYRGLAREKQEAARRRDAELEQRRRDVRRSNKSVHEAYGIASLTPQERLGLTVRALKTLAMQRERAADLERKNRWYNKKQVRRSAAPTHAQQLSSKAMHARRMQERLARDEMARVRSRQNLLQQEVKARVAKSTCAYVRGSYLLKVSSSNACISARPKSDSSRSAGAGETAPALAKSPAS